MEMLPLVKLGLSEICEYSGFNPATARSYINRGHVVGADGENSLPGKGTGRHRQYSWYALNQFFIAKRLMDVGLEAKTAFAAAVKYVHFGDRNLRHPSLPYHFSHGQTLLVVFPDEKVRVMLAKDLSPYSDHTSINCSKAFRDLGQKMGFDPDKVLMDAYPQAKDGSE